MRRRHAEEAAEQERLMELGMLNTLEPGGVAPAGLAVVGESTMTLSWIWYSSGRLEGDGAVLNEGAVVILIYNTLMLIHFTALKIEWCRARARWMRREEEVRLLVEEMRRVRAYGLWKAGWWTDRMTLRVSQQQSTPGMEPLSEEVSEGITAYANEHAAREITRVEQLNAAWDGLSTMAEAVLNGSTVTGGVDIELEEEEEDPILAD